MIKPRDMALDALVPHVARIGYAAIELWGRDEKLPEVVALANREEHGQQVFGGHGGPDVMHLNISLRRSGMVLCPSRSPDACRRSLPGQA